ncbi:MAG: class I SAM-dependent methyltransferase [Candidatus Wallbacteria bacterium]
MYNQEYFTTLYTNNYDSLYNFLCKNIFNIFNSEYQIIEFGCGNGGFINYFEKNYFKLSNIIQTDIFHQNNISSNRFKLKEIDGNCEDLPKADLIIAFDVIEHVLNQGIMFKNIFNLLKPKGTFIFTTPNSDSLKKFIYSIFNKTWCGYADKTHIILYDKVILKRNCQRYFSKTKIIGFTQINKIFFKHNILNDYFLVICEKE